MVDSPPDKKKKPRPKDPYDSASWLSRFLFLWTGDLLAVGATTPLDASHIPECSQLDESSKLVARLMYHWNHTDKTNPHRLFWAMVKSFFPEYGWIGLILLFETPLRIYQANLLGYLVNYFFGESPSTISIYNNGYIMSAMLVSASVIVVLCHHQYFFRGNRLGMQMRVALLGSLYNKSVKLHLRSLSKTATGKIVSLASQDIEILQFAGLFSHFIYVPLIEAAAVLYMGMQEVGISFFFGFVAILLMVPVQSVFSGLISKNRKATAARTDERIKLVNQALVGVRVMKMNGWELAFKDLVQSVRSLEVASLMRTNYLKAINEAVFFSAPNVVACIVWVSYVRTGHEITPKKMFTVLSLLVIVQLSFTKFFTASVQFLTEAWVSLQRIQALLELDEVEGQFSLSQREVGAELETCQKRNGGDGVDGHVCVAGAVVTADRELELAATASSTSKSKTETDADIEVGADAGAAADADYVIVCKDMSATWQADLVSVSEASSAADQLVLSDLNYSIKRGELVVVIGPVGSAKTSLLMSMLQELSPCRGSVTVTLHPPLLQGASAAESGSGATDLSVGYCAQEPWIMSSTIRANILFGREMDQHWYDEVVRVCSLSQDFKLLPRGDLTVIGDRGVNLSGGQRARVGLARVVYGRAALNLLDDPLSAVDPKVSAQLFNQVVCGTMKGLTRVLVTHQTQYLSSPSVSRVMILDRGKIAAFDTYAALKQTGELGQWIDALDAEDKERRRRASSAVSMDSYSNNSSSPVVDAVATGSDDSNNSITQALGNPVVVSADATGAVVTALVVDGLSAAGLAGAETDLDSEAAILAKKVDAGTGAGMDGLNKPEEQQEGITVQEDKAEGNVGWSSYRDYAGFIGSSTVLTGLVVVLLLGQLMSVAVYIYMAKWSKMSRSDQSSDRNVNAYIILVCVSVVVAVLRTCLWMWALTQASLRMHDSMLASVLRAPIQFFDANPVGRILNRFSKDIGFTDNLMPETVFDFLSMTLIVTSTIVVVALGSFYILVILLPLVYVFVTMRKYYMRTSREVKRLESISRSPVFSHLAESLDGLVTIRAFHRGQEFVAKNYLHIDNNTSSFFAYTSSARWLGFRLDFMTIVLFLVATFGSVLAFEHSAGIDPALLAVGIMYVIQLTGLFQWAVRQSAEVENHMVSVERIVAYKNIAPEPPLRAADMTVLSTVTADDTLDVAATRPVEKSIDTDKSSAAAITPVLVRATPPPASWPSRGEIVISHLECSYRADLPTVIRDVSFKIEAGQRVGIVGRTGAGKSSLMSVLLRLIDITAGSVKIDGVDISSIGLHDLRPKISVIPQVPFLFLGTVRQNLDMFGSFSDREVWAAIDALSLREVIMQKTQRPNGGDNGSLSPQAEQDVNGTASLALLPPVSALDALVAENGANFSVGERQLLCLCRAILQKNKILIMDEATANVDMDTDREIQNAIRREFKTSTVLMIAHRLQTVIDCDVVIVMADGKLVEMGHPYELLRKPRLQQQRTISGSGIGSDGEGKFTGDMSAPHDCSFAGMVSDTGPVMSRQLCDMAKLAYDERERRQRHQQEHQEQQQY